MANIPSSTGWKTSDWCAWFEQLLGQAKHHLEELRDGVGDASHNVHLVRKILKRLRTGMRLMRGVVDADILKKNRLLFRDAARLLAGSRDGTVRLRTFDGLVGDNAKETKGRSAEVRLLLANEASAGIEGAGHGAVEALEILNQASIPDRLWGEAGKGTIKGSLKRLLKRARRDYRDVVTGKSSEFHELRKRVKDMYYSLQALPGEPTGARSRVLASLSELEEALGLQNDVFVLEEWFNENGYDLNDCPQFWEAAAKRDKKLRKVIIKEGEILDELAKSPRTRKAFLTPSQVARIKARGRRARR